MKHSDIRPSKIKRKLKLARTAPPQVKAKWAAWVLIVGFTAILYLKGVGLWP